nr:MAG TPA: hypothetical protein [Caudoviricetes sp.]DAQ75046.1 MAG TPA: hypothetical protein [Caudoviricetes sp.]DAW33822.1 MAG TPA: hypothetical protein [Caudoviricetes sp.]
MGKSHGIEMVNISSNIILFYLSKTIVTNRNLL